jgi:hypothetical protein
MSFSAGYVALACSAQVRALRPQLCCFAAAVGCGSNLSLRLLRCAAGPEGLDCFGCHHITQNAKARNAITTSSRPCLAGIALSPRLQAGAQACPISTRYT